ncbi:hypothetical protein KAU11_11700 [Candidatus Babeliales bacterium]|nr:hypothetical protein [Candidatus Babeliales bacterium]
MFNKIKEYAESTGRTDMHFVDEGYLDFKSNHDQTTQEYQMEYILRHTADSMSEEGLVFVDSSIILTALYHRCIFLSEVDSIIKKMRRMSRTVVELWLIDIEAGAHWAQIAERMKLLQLEDSEEYEQRMELHETDIDHFTSIRRRLYSPPFARNYDMIGDSDFLYDQAVKIIGLVHFLQTRTIIMDINSRYRLNPNGSHSGDFSVQMDRRFNNVIAARVMSAIVPKSYNNITEGSRIIAFTWSGGETETFVMPKGSYNYSEILSMIQTHFQIMHATFTASMDVQTEKVTFADTVTNFSGFFSPTHSDIRLVEMLGFKPVITTEAATVTAPNKYSGTGNLIAIYLTSPQLFNKEMFSTNSPIMSRGVIAKIPVEWGDEVNDDTTNFNPSESQMYNFQYDPPLQFDYLHFTFFGDKTEINGADDGWYIIDFEGMTVSITLEVVVVIYIHF